MVYETVKNTFVVVYGNSSLTHSPLLFNNVQNHVSINNINIFINIYIERHMKLIIILFIYQFNIDGLIRNLLSHEYSDTE